MDLTRFESYTLKDGSVATLLDVSKPEAYVTWRVKHPNTLIVRTGTVSTFIDQVESMITEPDFDFINLSLLESLEVCRSAGRSDDLRYVFNTEDKTWYHLSSTGQFHKYSKVPGETVHYWVTTDITLKHIQSYGWCVPNKVFGYLTIATDDVMVWNTVK